MTLLCWHHEVICENPMLLTVTATFQPATELGYLLHNNPTWVHTFDLAFGQVHIFYPEVSEVSRTATLLLDVNPMGVVRRDRQSGFALEQYVNDRPYTASSFLSVAAAQVYDSALNGRSKERPQLVDTPLPLEGRITALPSRGGEGLLRRLFEPLGYTLTTKHYPLDAAFPQWGESVYYTLILSHTIRLKDLLSHLEVLITMLDDDKHYYVGSGWKTC
jgi:3' terminal RNA ribose 2'-O-methyltransferase Hen1